MLKKEVKFMQSLYMTIETFFQSEQLIFLDKSTKDEHIPCK